MRKIKDEFNEENKQEFSIIFWSISRAQIFTTRPTPRWTLATSTSVSPSELASASIALASSSATSHEWREATSASSRASHSTASQHPCQHFHRVIWSCSTPARNIDSLRLDCQLAAFEK